MYILKWRSAINCREAWFIRGLRPDGSYYGEFLLWYDEKYSGGRGETVSGKLSELKLTKVLGLISKLEEDQTLGEMDNLGPFVLAKGKLEAPIFIFRAEANDRFNDRRARTFLELISILEKILRHQLSFV